MQWCHFWGISQKRKVEGSRAFSQKVHACIGCPVTTYFFEEPSFGALLLSLGVPCMATILRRHGSHSNHSMSLEVSIVQHLNYDSAAWRLHGLIPMHSFFIYNGWSGIYLFSLTDFDCKSLIPTCKVAMRASLIFKEFTTSVSARDMTWWQRAWDLHSRFWIRVRTCTSCKSLGQPGFYLLIWAHKILFSEMRFPWIQKKRVHEIVNITASLL